MLFIQLTLFSYPIRDPFFNMLPRSLSNFMNAFTSADHTTYPFATTNQRDFKNLMSVYLDATLQPLLKETDFAQEGWRIGPETQESSGSMEQPVPDGDLEFKGVVYNEMKGQMSDANYLYYIRYQDHIFPDIHNSGGDPQKMTDLTYDQLRRFHMDHYHPSNAKVFSYGNMPLADHLIEIDSQFEAFRQRQADSDIKAPIKLDSPQTITVKGPIDPLVDKNMQHKVSTSWILGDTSNVHEMFALNVLSSLLLTGYGSPLYQALIESGIGPDFSPNTGLDNAGKTGLFCVGLNGVKAEDVPRVKDATQKALKYAHARGFDDRKVQGLLHQLELGLKHKTASFGLDLMHRIQPGWFNGVDPFDALAWNRIVSTFKGRYAKGGYLENLLEKYLLNDRTLTFIMEPSQTYEADFATEEQDRLHAKVGQASDKPGSQSQTESQLAEQEKRLLEDQKAARDQDLSCLPRVHVSDIPRQTERKPVRDLTVGSVQVQWRETSTNGLTYFRALNTLNGLPKELRQLVPLFCDSIFRLGTKTKSMEELEDTIKLKTGGIRASYYSTPSPTDPMGFSEGVSLSAYALDSNVPAMYELLQTVLRETDFDGPEGESMIRELINADANGALNAAANEGHAYCRRFAQAGLSPSALLSEQVSGLTQVQHVASLASRGAEGRLDDIIAKLKLIQAFAVSNSPGLRVALTCGSDAISSNESALQQFLSSLPQSKQAPREEVSMAEYARRSKAFFPLPYQVYHSALVLPTVGYTHPSSAHLQVLAQLLTHKYMLHEVREKGGAYGGGAYARGAGAVFGFYSYRDPNPQNTLRVVHGLGDWLAAQRWGAQELEEAKLSVFQSLDAPESVSDEGMTRFLVGIDEDMEQRRREQLLDAQVGDVLDAANKYVLGGMEKARIAVMGPKKDWVSEADGWVSEDLQVQSS